MSEFVNLLLQLVVGQVDGAWIVDVLVIIILGVIGFLFKEIKTDIKEIKNVQQNQAIRMARMETRLKIDEE